MHTSPVLTRRAVIGGLALTSLPLLAGCAGSAETASPTEELLDAHGLSGLDAREIIDELEALPLTERPEDLLASVLPDQLSLRDSSGGAASLLLPDGESYVSVAPFLEATHECFHHSLTTCLGELGERELAMQVAAADGEVLLDERRTTAPNGFLGLWLPRDQELTLTLALDGATATAPLRTDAESPTCLTAMQLSG